LGDLEAPKMLHKVLAKIWLPQRKGIYRYTLVSGEEEFDLAALQEQLMNSLLLSYDARTLVVSTQQINMVQLQTATAYLEKCVDDSRFPVHPKINHVELDLSGRFFKSL
jgi:hypothetical protein